MLSENKKGKLYTATCTRTDTADSGIIKFPSLI